MNTRETVHAEYGQVGAERYNSHRVLHLILYLMSEMSGKNNFGLGCGEGVQFYQEVKK